jgi:hypothetical protein
MTEYFGFDGSYWGFGLLIGLTILLLIGIFFELKPRNKAFKILGIIIVCIIAATAIFLLGAVIISVLTWIGFGLSILIIPIALLLLLTILIKFKEDILLAIFGAYLTAKIKAVLLGIWVFLSSFYGIGFIILSLIPIGWVEITDPGFDKIIEIANPAYIWFIANVIFSWGIMTMLRSLVKVLKSSLASTEPVASTKPDSKLKS